MKKLLRVLLVLVLLLLAALAAILVGLDPDDYREEISQKASEALGTEVRLDGPLELSLWPSIGLKTEQVQVLQPKAFGQGLWLEAGRVSFSTAVMPLLQGQLQLGEIHLSGVRLKLVRNAQGQANWEMLGSRADKGGPVEDKGDESTVPLSFQLAGLYMDDVALDYVDEQAGTRQRVEIQSLSLKGLGSSQPAQLRLRAAVKTPAVYRLNLEANMLADAGFSQLEVREIRLEVTGDSLPRPVTLAGQMQVDVPAATVRIPSMKLLDAIEIQGELGPAVRLAIQAQEMDLQPWLKEAPVQEGALGPLNLRLAVEGTPQAVQLRIERLEMVPLRLDGQLHWDGALKGKLNLAALNLDTLLRPSEAEETPVPAREQTLLAADSLPPLKVDVVLNMKALQLAGLKLENLYLQVQSRPGRLEVPKFSADLYQGQLRASARLQARGRSVGLESAGALQEIQAEPLLQDLAGKKLLSGQGGLRWNISTDVSTRDSLLRQLDGTASLRFENGAVLGINVAERIRQGWALLQGQNYQPPEKPPQTDFAELSASLKMEKGQVRNEDFLLKSPLLRVTGSGQVNLVEQTVDYQLTPVVVGTLTGQNGEALNQLKGVPIPLNIRGPLQAPGIQLDLARAFTEGQKKKLKKKAEKEVMKLLFGGGKKNKDKGENRQP